MQSLGCQQMLHFCINIHNTHIGWVKVVLLQTVMHASGETSGREKQPTLPNVPRSVSSINPNCPNKYL